MLRFTTLLFFVLALGSVLWAAVDNAPIYDIPRMDGVTVDGKADDWGNGGFHIGALAPYQGDLPAPMDSSASLRLGWNDKGLLLLATVYDDAIIESEENSALWEMDCIETYLAPVVGDKELCQWVLAAGFNEKYPEPRYALHDQRSPEHRNLPAVPTLAQTRIPGGYILEVLFPMSGLAITPAPGREVAFQAWVTDCDPTDSGTSLAWYPAGDTNYHHNSMYRLRLTDKASPDTLSRFVGGFNDTLLQYDLSVVAAREMAGKRVTINMGRRTVASGQLSADICDRSVARFTLPLPPKDKPYTDLTARIDGKVIASFAVPSADSKCAEALLWANAKAESYVFSGASLPKVNVEQPLLIEKLIGPYTVSTKYYDANYNPVTVADAPGRYGAVLEITRADGRIYRRFLTLFCQPNEVDWSMQQLKLDEKGLAGLGVSPAVATARPGTLSTLLSDSLANGVTQQENSAIALAALYETKGGIGDGDFYNNPSNIDRQWWVGFKRKLYGWDKRWSQPFVCPRPKEGNPAPVVHTGTMTEAGMKPDADARIDALLTEWSKDTDEAFSVCVVRHGVIVLHKAYGTRNGKPLTVDDKSYMASATKAISGSLVMMMVDQGLMNLDDEASQYLPTLEGIKTNQPLTIRRLYNHTSGIPGWHWGVYANDMEERMAALVPTLKVGSASEYCGTGLELTCKMIEGISGESLPNFYKHHLLDPLGCTHTDTCSASYMTEAAPLDIAKICQMLLNKGTYGNMRFMSEETFQQYLPRQLDLPKGAVGADYVYGVGTIWFGKNVFGHAAASAATMRIDMDNDLVIVMCRNTVGSNFDKYNGRFLKMILDNIDQPAQAPTQAQ